MLKMNTQYGEMTITDDNKTFATKELADEINKNEVKGKSANLFIIEDDFSYVEPIDKSEE